MKYLIIIILFLFSQAAVFNCLGTDTAFRKLTTAELIIKIQAATDPQNRLDKSSSKTSEGEFFMPAQNITAGVKTWFDAPDRFKIITTLPDGQQEEETYDGKVVLKKPAGQEKAETVTGSERNYFIFSALMEAPETDWDKLFSRIVVDDKYSKEKNHLCYRMTCTPRTEYSISGDVVFFVDNNDFLIRRMDMNTYYPGAGVIPQTVVIEEYKNIDGILVPVKSISNVLGAEIIYTIEKYAIRR